MPCNGLLSYRVAGKPDRRDEEKDAGRSLSDDFVITVLVDKTRQQAIAPTVEESMVILSQRDALLYLARTAHTFVDEDDDAILRHARSLLKRDLYPHMGKTKVPLLWSRQITSGRRPFAARPSIWDTLPIRYNKVFP
jgi:hypothetical protein